MATDYAEKERAFIAALSDDTGTDLAGWIARIASSALAKASLGLASKLLRSAVASWARASSPSRS